MTNNSQIFSQHSKFSRRLDFILIYSRIHSLDKPCHEWWTWTHRARALKPEFNIFISQPIRSLYTLYTRFWLVRTKIRVLNSKKAKRAGPRQSWKLASLWIPFLHFLAKRYTFSERPGMKMEIQINNTVIYILQLINFTFFIYIYTVCFQILVTFLRWFLDERSAYALSFWCGEKLAMEGAKSNTFSENFKIKPKEGGKIFFFSERV